MITATEDIVERDVSWEGIERLDRDLCQSSELLGQREARYLVDSYYQIQNYRIRSAGQIRSSDGEPNKLLEWHFSNQKIQERNLQRALGRFAASYRVGKWLQSICGIGPVISAGLLAHLDIRDRPTAGHFWRFAGLDSTLEWGKGEKRPYNQQLKTLVAFKAGESFIKCQNRDKDVYGHIYADRWSWEWEKNLNGEYADEADRQLNKKNYAKNTVAYKYMSGQVSPELIRTIRATEGRPPTPAEINADDNVGVQMLSADHIKNRARRYAAKMFLSHLHHVMYEDYYSKEPPMPYAIEKLPVEDNHRHYIPVPNWPSDFNGRGLEELYTIDSTT